jgi:hypothetical protein
MTRADSDKPTWGCLLSLTQRLAPLASIPRRARKRLRTLLQGRARCFPVALSLVEGKRGLEIGGPTEAFRRWQKPSIYRGWRTPLPIYDRVGSLDNCVFSSDTLWAAHQENYQFSAHKSPGRTIIAEGSALSSISNHTYEFVLSSHNLEHFANPVKALKEWQRITQPNGALVLVLPDYRKTFDHRRTPTPVDHMLEDYMKNVGEEDATHVPEVLQLHDLSWDDGLNTRTIEALRVRSTNNLANRCLHHHVFDEVNSADLLTRVGLEILAIELALPCHIFILSRWK